MKNPGFQTAIRLLLILFAGCWTFGTPNTGLAAEHPELRIANLSLSRGVALLDETVEAVATIENTGAVGVKHVTVRFYFGQRKLGEDYLIDVDAHSSVEVSTAFKARPQGKRDLIVEVDPDNRIAEANKRNNTARRTLGIFALPNGLGEAPAPGAADDAQVATGTIPPRATDLKLVSFTVTPDRTRAGQPLQATVRLRNTGDLAVDTLHLRFAVDGKPVGQDDVIAIAENAQTTVTHRFSLSTIGKHRLQVIINPDRRVPETDFANNHGEAKVEITPGPTPAVNHTATAAPSSRTKGPNLVCQLETRQDIHYFDGKTLKIKILNTSPNYRANPSMLGIRALDAPNKWVARVAVPALEPTASTVVSVPWPQSAKLGGEFRYVAIVDADNNVDEGAAGEKDNRTLPFSLALLDRDPARAHRLTLIEPTGGAPRASGHTVAIKWKAEGLGDERVTVSLIHPDGTAHTLAEIPAATGRYDWRVPELAPGNYRIQLHSGTVTAQSEPFPVRRLHPAAITVTVPTRNSEWRVGGTYTVHWHVAGDRHTPLKILLVDADQPSHTVTITQTPVVAGQGRMSWDIPINPSVFGRYYLRFDANDGRVAGRSQTFSISPPAIDALRVPPETAGGATITRIKADLAVIDAGFSDGFFSYTLKNLGPDAVPSSVISGLRLRTYYVGSDPVIHPDAYQACEYNMFGALAPGEERLVVLGHNPDCKYGMHTSDERFKYAVVRIEIPRLVNVDLIDPDLSNNVFKAPYARRLTHKPPPPPEPADNNVFDNY